MVRSPRRGAGKVTWQQPVPGRVDRPALVAARAATDAPGTLTAFTS